MAPRMLALCLVLIIAVGVRNKPDPEKQAETPPSKRARAEWNSPCAYGDDDSDEFDQAARRAIAVEVMAGQQKQLARQLLHGNSGSGGPTPAEQAVLNEHLDQQQQQQQQVVAATGHTPAGQSFVWHIFAKKLDEDGHEVQAIKSGKDVFARTCLVCNEVVWASKRCLIQMERHLTKHPHKLSAEDIKRMRKDTKLADHFRQTGSMPAAKANATTPKKDKNPGREDDTQGVLPCFLMPKTKAQSALTRAYATCYIIRKGDPIPPGPSSHEQAFWNSYSRHCQAKFVWKGPCQSSLKRCVASDVQQMGKKLADIWRSFGKGQGTVHHDGWEDGYHRHWLAIMLTGLSGWQQVDAAIAISLLGKRAGVLEGDDAGSAQSASNMANTILREWQHCLGRDLGFANSAMSNNTAPAVCASQLLHTPALRCCAHLLQIIVRRTCFDFAEEKYKDNLQPSLEKLRKFAGRFSDTGFRATWIKHGWGGQHGKCLKRNSSSSWGSTLALVSNSRMLQSGMETAAARIRDRTALGELPIPEEWEVLEALQVGLEHTQMAISTLQQWHALAAQVLPVFAIFDAELCGMLDDPPAGDEGLSSWENDIATYFRAELRRVIDVHLDEPLFHSRAQNNDFFYICSHADHGLSTTKQLLEVASLLCTGFQFLEGDEEEQEEIIKRFCCVCVRCYELEHPEEKTALEEAGEGAGAIVPLGVHTESESVRQSPRGRGRGGRGRSKKHRVHMVSDSVAEKWKSKLGSAQASAPQTISSSYVQAIWSAGRAFLTNTGSTCTFPGALDSAAILAFYRGLLRTSYQCLTPGIQWLLSIPAGNADLERFFTHAQSMYADGRRFANSGQLLVLRHNYDLVFPDPAEVMLGADAEVSGAETDVDEEVGGAVPDDDILLNSGGEEVADDADAEKVTERVGEDVS
eukprot:TRINITY_DN9779_c0_g1_i1.p1 TRINITY_DN9779_c0_g1~~TRINITY_DN9779_c0_g1_i1.p1  ORF type:complete len:929 (-),score=147.09 TRINITY_DN9779_c0_g1_i1:36-2789(-)